MRVAAGQAASVTGDLDANVRQAVRLTGLAATQDVRLLVLPEAFLACRFLAVRMRVPCRLPVGPAVHRCECR